MINTGSPNQKVEGIVTIEDLNEKVQLQKQSSSQSNEEKVNYTKIKQQVINSKPWIEQIENEESSVHVLIKD